MGPTRRARPDSTEFAEWHSCASHSLGVLRARYVRQSFALHFHETYVVCVDVRGAHSSWYRGGRVTIPERTLCVVPPGEVHTGEGVPGAPWVYRAVYPGVELMAALARGAGLPETAVPALRTLYVDDPALTSAFVEAHRRCDAEADPLAVEGGLVEALSTLLRRHGSLPARPFGGGRRSRRAQVVVEYLRDCYAQRITVHDLTRATGLSGYAVLRAFRREVGMPPHRFLTQVRVERAKRLLREAVTPATVALRVGFADQSHLNRHFGRIVGVTPGAYARACAPQRSS